MGDELNTRMLESPFLCVLAALREILIVRIYDFIYQKSRAKSKKPPHEINARFLQS